MGGGLLTRVTERPARKGGREMDTEREGVNRRVCFTCLALDTERERGRE